MPTRNGYCRRCRGFSSLLKNYPPSIPGRAHQRVYVRLRRAMGANPESITPVFPQQLRQGLWIPALAEPVIGPRFARTRWLGRNDRREFFTSLLAGLFCGGPERSPHSRRLLSGGCRTSPMQDRSSSSLMLLYIGLLATALSVIAFGLMTTVQASVGLSQASARTKTLLDLRIDSSREIRQALATPMITPPLPPITVRLARAIPSATGRFARVPQAALDAMAMDQIAMGQGAMPPLREFNYPAPDRHATSF